MNDYLFLKNVALRWPLSYWVNG